MQIKQEKSAPINGKKMTVGVVRARFNAEITSAMLKSALDELNRSGVSQKNIKLVEVAGSMEIPFALIKLAETKKYDCLVAIGCVIRGETPHFDYVCKMAQEGALRICLDYKIPIGFGIQTVNSLKQAQARHHIGAAAVKAALELALI